MYLRRLTSCSRALAFVGVGARALAFLGVGVGVAPRGVMSLSGTAPPPAASCRLSERVRDGCLGAVKAGFVADAASMGLHWIYDVSKLKELTKSQSPEFFEPPSCPFYKYEPGQLSPYGAEALGVLHVLSPCHDKFEPQNFSLGFQQYLKKYPGRLNHASKELIAAVESGKVFPESGADDAQANSLVKVAVALSKFEGRDDWAMRVEDVLRAHQNNEIAVRYGMAAAHLMRHILQSGSIRESLAWATGAGSPLDAEAKSTMLTAIAFGKDKSCLDAAAAFGSSCKLPAAFSVSVHLLSKDLPYEEAVRENILAGGDQCSRAVFVGACYGAAHGEQVVPPAWAAKVTDMREIESMARLLVTCSAPAKL